MARTRRQVTLQEQESGIPASPPHSLPTATRSTRAKRTTTRNDTTTAPADPPPPTQGGPAVRGSRISRPKRVARGRAQPRVTTSPDAPESLAVDVDVPEASDSSTQVEAAVQVGPTARTGHENDKATEDMEELDVESPGETQFPIGVSAHPVQVQDMTAHPVQGSTTPPEPLESATSLKFRDILQGKLRSPDPSPGPYTPTTVAPVVPLNPTLETSSLTPTPKRVAPVSSSPSKPIPQAPSPTSKPTVYFVPSNPECSHALITLQMNYIQGSKDPVQPSKPAAFVVPSDLVAPFCRYIESRAKPGSDLSKLTTDHPVVKDYVQGDARYRPRLPSWQSQESPPLPGSTMKDAFIRRAQRKRGFREMEEETATLKAENARLKAITTEASHSNTLQKEKKEGCHLTESPQKRTKIVPDPYTPDGRLLLGRTKEIEVDEYGVAVNPTDDPTLRWNDMEARKRAQLDEARRIANVVESPYVAEEKPNTDGPALGGLFAESQNQVQQEQVPETPRTRGWGLSSFLPSARSVTKYLPFSSRRAIPTPQHQQPSQPEHVAQTERPVNADSSQPQADPDVADSIAGPGHRRRNQSTSNQQRLLTKKQSEEEKRIKKMRAQLRREAEALEKQKKDLEIAKKDLAEQQNGANNAQTPGQKKDLEIAKKDLAEQQNGANNAQTPGQKRKRLPSPDIIPLPANGGYGMVDEYFVVDSSSDEEDTAVQETPTKERPLKKARTSAPDDAIVSSPFRARPYTGTLFAHPDAQRSREVDNVFVESDEPHAHPALDRTPPPGPTLTFKVPSPGSSDSDDDEDDETAQEISSPSVPQTKSILRNSTTHSNQSQPRPIANSPSPSKSMAPPRPNLGHANLPIAPTMASSGALEKAREKALRHQPKQPSTLRESSRLSSSTVNSDAGDQENAEEYDPAHPAGIPTSSNAPVFGEPNAPAVPVFEQPVINPTAPKGSQQPVSQAVSETPHEQQAVPNTSGKQAKLVPNIFGASRADDVRLSGQEAVPAKKQNDILNFIDHFNANRNPKIKADLDRYWEEHGDDYVLDDGYEEFEKAMLAEEQELMDGPNGHPYTQPHNIISTALERIGADGLADRGIQTEIEDNWRPEDLERTQSDPANGMRVFFNRLVKNGGIEKELADSVIARGVPSGTTEYLAGQGTVGPVTV